VQHAPRAAARITAVVIVLAAGGLAAGAASASGTQATSAQGTITSLTYRCRFPSGPHPVQVAVSASVPAAARTGKPIQPDGVSLTITLPPAAVSGLASLHTATVSAAARLAVSASEGPSGTSVVWPGITKRPVPRPGNGNLTLTTAGAVPPVTASSAGEVILTAADLSVTFTGGKAAAPVPGLAQSPTPPTGEPTAVPGTPATSGTPTTVGTTLQVTCALANGQHATLATVPITGAATGHSRRSPTVGRCPKLPPGGLKLNPRFPPPPHPPLTLVGHSPSQGCAFTTGYADVRKLKGAALIAPAMTNVDQALTTLANTTSKINYIQLQNAAQLDFHGLHQFPPSTATFLTFGFVPTTATIELIEHGTINIFVVGPVNPFIPCQPNRFRTCSNVATVFSRLSAGIVPGSVKVNGVPLDVGSQCETPQFDVVVTGTATSKPPYSIQFGGPLTGTVTIPPFKHCGVGENLDPIFNAAISGPQNFNLLTQGELCSVIGALGCNKQGLPKIPTPIRKVTG